MIKSLVMLLLSFPSFRVELFMKDFIVQWKLHDQSGVEAKSLVVGTGRPASLEHPENKQDSVSASKQEELVITTTSSTHSNVCACRMYLLEVVEQHVERRLYHHKSDRVWSGCCKQKAG